MTKTILFLLLVFVLPSTADATRKTTAETRVEKRTKFKRNAIKTTRVVVHTATGVAVGLGSLYLANKYGIITDANILGGGPEVETKAKILFSSAAYLGNESIKAVTGNILKPILAKHEGPETVATRPQSFRHKVLGALGAGAMGVVPFYGPITGQWMGKLFASEAAKN